MYIRMYVRIYACVDVCMRACMPVLPITVGHRTISGQFSHVSGQSPHARKKCPDERDLLLVLRKMKALRVKNVALQVERSTSGLPKTTNC